MLLQRAERRDAQREGRLPRALSEGDFLLGVDDETRQGALRFREAPGGQFLAPPSPTRVPPLVDLPRLLGAADRVAAESEDDDDLQLLLAPGASLGGARPKASVQDRNGRLALAKFPQSDDEWNVPLWEAVALSLASRAGITTSSWRLETVSGRPVLVLHRFDRSDGHRIPFLLRDDDAGSNRPTSRAPTPKLPRPFVVSAPLPPPTCRNSGDASCTRC